MEPSDRGGQGPPPSSCLALKAPGRQGLQAGAKGQKAPCGHDDEEKGAGSSPFRPRATAASGPKGGKERRGRGLLASLGPGGGHGAGQANWAFFGAKAEGRDGGRPPARAERLLPGRRPPPSLPPPPSGRRGNCSSSSSSSKRRPEGGREGSISFARRGSPASALPPPLATVVRPRPPPPPPPLPGQLFCVLLGPTRGRTDGAARTHGPPVGLRAATREGPASGQPAMRDGERNPASAPAPAPDVQGDGRWMSLHHRFIADSKDKEPEVVFIGDSLVQLLHQFEIWRELFSPLHALNFGIGGDTTQHVLWRLQNGELQHIRPKIVVVWVGTNNHGHTAEQVAGGIEAIVRLIHQQQPQARVVVLGLLPRGKNPNPLREKNQRVNELLESKVPLLPNATFLNADPGFVHSDGTISHHDMYDYLHLTRNGYARLCPGLHRLLLCLLGECHAQAP